jgi:hypothetical protein
MNTIEIIVPVQKDSINVNAAIGYHANRCSVTACGQTDGTWACRGAADATARQTMLKKKITNK